MSKQMIPCHITANGGLVLVVASFVGSAMTFIAVRPSCPWWLAIIAVFIILVCATIIFGVLSGAIEGIDKRDIECDDHEQDKDC